MDVTKKHFMTMCFRVETANWAVPANKITF